MNYKSKSLVWLLTGFSIASALALRVYLPGYIFSSELTSDEIAMSSLYPSRVFKFENYPSGASQLTSAALMYGWFKLFGFTSISARYFSFFWALIGIITFYFCVKHYFSKKEAFFSTVALFINPSCILFSSLGIEVVFSLIAPVVIVFLLSLKSNKTSKYQYRSLLIGFIIGISFFTYPGVILSTLALFGSWLVYQSSIRIKQIVSGRLDVPLLEDWRRMFIGIFLAYLLFLLIDLKWLNGGRILLSGGGHIPNSLDDYFNALRLILYEMVVRQITWYSGLINTSLAEWTHLPFLILTLVYAFRKTNNKKSLYIRVMILCLILNLFAVAGTGAAVGIRRGLSLCLLLAVFAGRGFTLALNYFHSSRYSLILSTVATLLFIAPVRYYPELLGLRYKLFPSTYAGWGIISPKELNPILQQGTIFLLAEEFEFELDRYLQRSLISTTREFASQKDSSIIFPISYIHSASINCEIFESEFYVISFNPIPLLQRLRKGYWEIKLLGPSASSNLPVSPIVLQFRIPQGKTKRDCNRCELGMDYLGNRGYENLLLIDQFNMSRREWPVVPKLSGIITQPYGVALIEYRDKQHAVRALIGDWLKYNNDIGIHNLLEP
ncbi:MAG: glycosyltransferase family 39 protein [Deltaproteobacteria bacterium]|nr:glycosyltransferase family 39 protein [Deltaproteobacteria bacterium]